MVIGLVIGLVLIGIGILMIWLKGKSEDTVLELKSVKTSAAADLDELCRSISAEIGPGGFSQLAEVKGVAEADSPIRSELSNTECVWYSMKVEERYEEMYTETDSDGNTSRRTRTGTTTVASNSNGIPFLVRDESGSIMVDPTRAKVEGRKVLDRHEPAEAAGHQLTFGTFSFTVAPTNGRRVLGYNYTEHAIPVGAHLYVIGEACDRDDGKLCIRTPAESGKPFIISTRSEEEITKGYESAAKAKKWVGFGLIGLGLIVMILGVAGVFS